MQKLFQNLQKVEWDSRMGLINRKKLINFA